MEKGRGNFRTGSGGIVVRGGVRGEKSHRYSPLPQPLPRTWWFSDYNGWGLSNSTAGKGKDAEAQTKSLKPATRPSQSAFGIVLTLTQDATTWDLHPRTQPRCEVWWAPSRRHPSAIQTLVSKHQHFNAVTNSQPQGGTQFGKSVRQVPKNLMFGSQQTAQTAGWENNSEHHLWGNWLYLSADSQGGRN